MAQTIKLKRSATQNAVPSTSSLALGEIALNTYDGKLFIKKDVGGTESIVTIGAVGAGSVGPTELASTAVTAGSYGSTSAIPVITIDADGRITSASTATISGLSANSVTSTEIAANAVGISELDVTDGTDGQVLTTDGSGTLTFETPTGGAASANAFATNIASGNGSTATFTLSSTPSAESKIIAFINGVFQNQDAYTISGTDITFDTAPISGTNNVVVYVIGDVYSGESVLISNFNGNGSTTAFTLSNNPGNENNTQVYIDGVYQQKTTYSVSGTTLTFSTAPPTGTANIEVVMLTSTTVNTPAAGSVVTASMADDSVTGAKIVSSAVTTAKIADANVTTAKIADANITTAKIANDAVTLDKIADAVFVTESEGISSNDNDTTLPTSAAVKDYVDGKDFETGLAGDSGTGTVNTSQTLTVSGTANEVNTSVSGQTVTVGLPNSVSLTSNLTVGGYIAGPASFTIDPAGVGDNTGTVVIAGNLQVDGTQTVINSTSMSVDDLNLTLASGAASASAANGAGLTIDGASATLLYASSGDKFVFNKTVDATIGTAAQPNITSIGTLTALTGGTGDLNWDSGTLFVDSSANAVGIGTNSPTAKLTIDNSISTTYSTTGYAATPANSMLYLNNTHGGSNTASLINFRTGTGDGVIGFVEGGGTNDADFVIQTDGGSNGVERLRILNSGNVGIGDPSPSAKLEVAGSSNSTYLIAGGDDSSNGRALTFTSSAGANFNGAIHTIRAPSSQGEIAFKTYNTEVMRIDSSANVGIGANNPLSKLHVFSATATSTPKDTYAVALFDDDEGRIQVRATNNGSDGAVVGLSTGSHNWGLLATAAGTFSNAFAIGYVNTSTDGNVFGCDTMSEKLIITTNGNVGIGATNPTSTLEIHSSVGIIPDTTNASLQLRDTSAVGANNGGSIVFSGIYTGTSGHLGSGPYIKAYKLNSTSGDYSYGLKFATRQNGVGSQAVGLTITPDQKVGIGTPTPAHPLSVQGANAKITACSTADSQIVGFQARYLLDHATLYGSFEYHTGDAQLYIDNHFVGNNGVYSDINFRNKDTSGSFHNRLKIKGSTGNVGIGTQSPLGKLHVRDGSEQSGISHSYIYDFSAITMEATEPSIQLMAEDSGTHGGSLLWRYGNNVFAAIANPTTDKLDFTYGLSTSNEFQVHSGANLGNYTKMLSIPSNGRNFDFNSDTANLYNPKINLYSKASGAYGGEINFYSKHNSNEWIAASIFSTGGSGYGTGSPPSGGMRFYVRGSFGQTHALQAILIADNGVVSGDFNDTSDVALKKDIVSLSASDSITAIKALNPVSFKWKLDDEARSGFIAQEVETHLPNDVVGEDWRAEVLGEEGDPSSRDEGSKGKAVNSTGILAHAVKVIQEQQKEIEALKARVTTLEG